ncbi:MAG: HEPN domain-containing protein [archaeon]
MNFGKLLDDKKIEKVEKTDFNLDSAEKDLEFPRKGIEIENYNWAMAVAYEIILKTGNELMNFLGYRSIGKEHHKNTFEFLIECNIDKELTNYFDKIRVKRNNFIYRGADEIGKDKAKEIIQKAEEFVQKIRT